MTAIVEAAECDRLAERHLVTARRAASMVARIANLNMAAVLATRSERLRSTLHVNGYI